MRGKAIVKVPKKNMVIRAIEGIDDSKIKKLEESVQSDVAILFSYLDAFELAGELINSKSPAKAKPGQVAPEDIEIQAGPTELPPGPAISELGALGLQVQVQDGKIHIRKAKVIAKKGEPISQGAADLMTKLGIKPFSVGFIPLAAFDIKEGKFYNEIRIDREATLAKLKEAHSRAIPFAVHIGYPSKDTIHFLIGKAGRHANALKKFNTPESKSSGGGN